LAILEKVSDEELAGNGFKIVRLILRDDMLANTMQKAYPNIGNVIVDLIAKWQNS